MELLSYAFDSTCTFNFRKCVFKFENREFAMVPGDTYTCDVVHTIAKNSTERDAIFQLIHRFLYRYGWANRCSFHFAGHVAQGISQQSSLNDIKFTFIINRKYRNLLVNFDRIVPPVAPELELALSLFNDANYTNDLFYRFLCFWKILQINLPGRRKLPAHKWIDDRFSDGTVSLPGYLHDLVPSGTSLGEFLKDECRNAIAHITREPTVLSYKASDCEKIGRACTAIEPFVEYFIRRALDMPEHHDNIEVLAMEGRQLPAATRVNHDLFVHRWLARAQRGVEAKIDTGDRFISLWIAFNAWMKGKYGEDSSDRYLIDQVKSSNELQNMYRYLIDNSGDFSDNLGKIKRYTVSNMRFVNDESRVRKYDDTFESLIEVIYQIRCNLFHGRKNISEDKKDFELVCLAYAILLPLLKTCLGEYGN